MNHFFVDPSRITDGTVCISGGDVNHIKNVLRLGVGDAVSVSDGQEDVLYLCRITSVQKDRVEAVIEKTEKKGSELPSQIFLFQGLPKSDKMDLIVQKAVELGACEIIPVATRRTVVKLDEKKEKAKCARWNAIAEGAAKQSGRMAVPRVSEPMDFGQALSYAQKADRRLIPYELARDMQETRSILENIRRGQSVAVFIGPEGGFEEEEVQAACEAGFVPITLGGRILRTETAGLAVLAVLGYLLQ